MPAARALQCVKQCGGFRILIIRKVRAVAAVVGDSFSVVAQGLCDGQRGLAIDAVLTGHETLQIQQCQWQR